MNTQERLAHTLWWIVMLMTLAFFCFAAAVFMLERREPAEVVVVYEPASVSAPKRPSWDGQRDEHPVSLDPLVEDTYLREDIPLSYELQAALYGACLEFGVEYELALAVIEQETRFTNVMGDSGSAYGYFQIWPKWHKGRMDELGVTDLMDPESNFRVGCSFLSECIGKYGVEKGLGYYNSGSAQVTQYSREVMARWEQKSKTPGRRQPSERGLQKRQPLQTELKVPLLYPKLGGESSERSSRYRKTDAYRRVRQRHLSPMPCVRWRVRNHLPRQERLCGRL